MSFDIVKNLIPGLPKESYYAGHYVGVVAHATANNGDSDDGERNYESTTWQNAFVHFFVDDTKIEQVADTNYLAFGAGHTANHMGYAQVELCQSTDAIKFVAAYAKYVWLLAYLLFEGKLGVVDGVTLMSHAQVSSKWKETDHEDPIEYLASHGKTWANVVADVTAQYALMEGDSVVTTKDHVVITTKLGLNLRESYNTSAKILAVIPYETTCVVVGTEPGWYEIIYGSIQGWVSAEYVKFTPKVVPVEKAVQTSSKVPESQTVDAVVSSPKAVVAPVIAPIEVAPVKPEVSVEPVPAPVSKLDTPIVTPPIVPIQVEPPVPVPAAPNPIIPAVVSPVNSITIQETDLETLTQLNNLLNKILGGK